MRMALYFCALPPKTYNPSLIINKIKKQTNPNLEPSYKMPEQYTSKLSRLLKPRRA